MKQANHSLWLFRRITAQHVLDAEVGGVCLQNQNIHKDGWCNDLKEPLEVDILASHKLNHVSYITKKPRINMICGCMLQNKEGKVPHNKFL